MRQAVVGLVVLVLVFGAGVVTGRATLTPAVPESALATAEPTSPGEERMPIAVGGSAAVGEWTVRVEDVDLEGAGQVLAANQFNTAPADGWSFVVVDVVAVRRASGPGVLRGDLDAALVTPSDRRYPLGSDCGVVREPLDVEQLVGLGGEVGGQWCWSVRESDLPKVRLRVVGVTGDTVWFSLR